MTDEPKKFCPINVVEAQRTNVERIMQGRDKPVLIQYYANWCDHCRKTKPEVDKASQQLCGDANVVRVNVEQHSALAEKLGIEGLPTMVLMEDGKVLGKIEGEATADELTAFVRNRGRASRAQRALRKK
jgi:thioredoxin